MSQYPLDQLAPQQIYSSEHESGTNHYNINWEFDDAGECHVTERFMNEKVEQRN